MWKIVKKIKYSEKTSHRINNKSCCDGTGQVKWNQVKNRSRRYSNRSSQEFNTTKKLSCLSVNLSVDRSDKGPVDRPIDLFLMTIFCAMLLHLK